MRPSSHCAGYAPHLNKLFGLVTPRFGLRFLSTWEPSESAVVGASGPVAAAKKRAATTIAGDPLTPQQFDAVSSFSGGKDMFQISSTIRTSRRHSHRHRSHCHPCLTCSARSGSTAEFEDKAQVDARFAASHTRGMESTCGVEETHARSPLRAQTTPGHRECHGRNFGTQQRSIVFSMAPICRAASASVLASFCQFLAPIGS